MVFAKYNDLTKDSCQGTNWVCHLTKNCKPPNLLNGIFELWWQLRKLWLLKKFICTRNGFLLTDFFLHNKQFCLLQTGPKHLTITLQIRLGGFILLVVWYTVFSTQQPPLIRKEQTGHYEERTEQKRVSARINNRGHCEEKAIVKGVRGIGRGSTAQELLDVIYTSPKVSVRSPRHFFFSSFPIFFVIIVWQIK